MLHADRERPTTLQQLDVATSLVDAADVGDASDPPVWLQSISCGGDDDGMVLVCTATVGVRVSNSSGAVGGDGGATKNASKLLVSIAYTPQQEASSHAPTLYTAPRHVLVDTLGVPSTADDGAARGRPLSPPAFRAARRSLFYTDHA